MNSILSDVSVLLIFNKSFQLNLRQPFTSKISSINVVEVDCKESEMVFSLEIELVIAEKYLCTLMDQCGNPVHMKKKKKIFEDYHLSQ